MEAIYAAALNTDILAAETRLGCTIAVTGIHRASERGTSLIRIDFSSSREIDRAAFVSSLWNGILRLANDIRTPVQFGKIEHRPN